MDFTEAYSDRCSAVGLAAREGDVKCLKKLIRQGYSIDVPDNRGWMPIHEAAFHNTSKCLKHLICAAPSDNYIRSKTFEGTCSLHLSASRGSLECAALLLESGADPNELTNDATTPLFLGANVNCQATDRATPLFIAAQEGNDRCVELLLSSGADPNLYCNEEEWQLPIHAAAQMGHSNILQMLIPVTDQLCGRAEGKVSPVYSAIYGDHTDCLELLLKEGYSPDAQPCPVFSCRSPMSLAIQKGFGLVPLLLKYGITPLETDLNHFLRLGNFSLFQLFLKRGCKFPSGQHLAEFSKCTINAGGKYREWLPSLLLAGFNPLNPLCKPWLCSLENDVLNFLLEFTNWKRLPLDVEQILSVRKGASTWVPHRHFECIPSLSHLCRLEIRSLLTSDRLRSDQFVHQLPLPDCLQNFLLYSDILHTYDISEHWLKLWEAYGENSSQSSSSSDNTERRGM
uniref:Ankyrin repeat and SOCS box containing 3 n=1 Tax=Anolis carolinensis TaxID=28377 RepID=A0A803T3A7_ANOCA